MNSLHASSNDESGVRITMPGMNHEAFCLFRDIDFGIAGATGFRAEACIGSPCGWIEIRIDGPEGPKMGICQVAARDLGMNEWGTVKAGVHVPPGTHDVFLRFSGFGAGESALREIRFTSDPVVDNRFDGVALPRPAPYLGPIEPYFLGSGVAGAGGNTAGIWDYLIGPGYTFHGYVKSCESFIRREELLLMLDGREVRMDLEMRRVSGTGMFAGTAEVGFDALAGTCIENGIANGIENGIESEAEAKNENNKKTACVRVHVLDFANRGDSWVCRQIRVENLSEGTDHEVEVRAVIIPDGRSFSVLQGRTLKIVHDCDDKESDKQAAIGFSGSGTSAVMHGEQCMLKSGLHKLSARGKPGDALDVALLHCTFRDMNRVREVMDFIGGRDENSLAKDAGRCITEWADWFSLSEQLSELPAGRTRDALEGALAIIRMLQGSDGGIMATARSYMDSYVRDSAGALRGLTAFGFHREAEDFLLWAHHKFEMYDAIVCDANIGDDANWFPGYGGEDNWAAESPALYLLTAQDYYRCMQVKERGGEALGFLRRLEGSLRFATRVQLESLLRNGWKLRFNGDETESGGSGIPLADAPDIARYWSMPSLVLCAASLEFYIELLSNSSENTSLIATGSGALIDLHEALRAVKDSIDANFWRTDLLEYPDGFYDWYRSDAGGWPKCRITNFSLFPACHGVPLNHPERAELSVRAMKRHYSAGGFLPIQPGGLNEGFCGHDLGYLLHALSLFDDPMAGEVFEALIGGGTMGCWGTWSEAYSGDGMTHTLPRKPSGYLVANMRPFETGVNVAAIGKYLAGLKLLGGRL